MADVWSSTNLVQVAMEQVRNAVVITDADFSHDGPHVVMCNPAFVAMTGYGADEILGRNLRILQGPDTDPEVIARLRACLTDDTYFEGQTVNYRKDGTPYNVQWSISPVRDDSGRVTHYVSVQQDITARLRAEAERDMLAEALQVVADPVMVTDFQHRVVFVNQAFEHVTGYAADMILGQTPRVLYEGTGSEGTYEVIAVELEARRPVHEQVTIRTREGHLLHTVHSVTPNHQSDPRLARNISSFTDVTDLVRSAGELHKQATTDVMTGLSNRRAGELALQALLEERVSGRPLSVALCDIDHFKRVNDTYGHLVGDRVIALVAQGITTQVRGDDIAVRWGGEEFLIVLPGASLAAALRTAERVRAAIESVSDDEAGPVTISIGVTEAVAGDDGASVIKRADDALYAAKSNGRNRVEAG
jgi:diguanylate cyclase (GGDEF)-like protein/PAS domain S-box-containing protein